MIIHKFFMGWRFGVGGYKGNMIPHGGCGTVISLDVSVEVVK